MFYQSGLLENYDGIATWFPFLFYYGAALLGIPVLAYLVGLIISFRGIKRWVILAISFTAWMLTVDRIPWVPLLLVTLIVAAIVAPEQTAKEHSRNAPPDREQSVI